MFPIFIRRNNFALSYDRVYKIEDNFIEGKWNTYNKILTATSQKKSIPDGITLYYGSAYIIANRDFLQWVTTDVVPSNLINWSRDTYSPDEMIWATLSRIYQKQKNFTTAITQQSMYRSNKLPLPTQNLVWETNDVLPDSGQFEPQFSYARTVKWENEALKWNPPYPVCRARFLLKD